MTWDEQIVGWFGDDAQAGYEDVDFATVGWMVNPVGHVLKAIIIASEFRLYSKYDITSGFAFRTNAGNRPFKNALTGETELTPTEAERMGQGQYHKRIDQKTGEVRFFTDKGELK